MADKSKTIWAHCNTCLGDRNHLVLYEKDEHWEDLAEGRYSISGSETYRMLKCGGCNAVHLQHASWCSEDIGPDGSPEINITYFPPAISKAEPSWTLDLEWFGTPAHEYIARLLREIYSAMHNDSRRLVVMGIRALLEHVMVSSVGDKGSFKNNLDAYQKAGFLSPKQREIIEPILEAGHATMHRGFDPNAEDVRTVVDIAEGLIETTIVHPKKASELKKRVPKKKKKRKKRKT